MALLSDNSGLTVVFNDWAVSEVILPVQWTIVSVSVSSVARSSFGRGTELAATADSSRLNDPAFTVGGILAPAKFRPNYRQLRMSPSKKFYRNGRLPEENRLAIGCPVGITLVHWRARESLRNPTLPEIIRLADVARLFTIAHYSPPRWGIDS